MGRERREREGRRREGMAGEEDFERSPVPNLPLHHCL